VSEKPNVARRSADKVQALLVSAGVREEADAEAEEVAKLVMHRFAHEVEGDERPRPTNLRCARRSFTIGSPAR
jgi:hypothetical protein